jgi:hypothetical protein
VPAPFSGTLRDEPPARVDQAVDQRDLRSVAPALRSEEIRRVARKKDLARHSRPRRVRRGSPSGVARARQRDSLEAELFRLRDRGRQAARLEGAGGIAGFILDPQVRETLRCAETLRAQERRPSFAERHDVPLIVHGHHLAPPPDRSRAVVERIAVDREMLVSREQRSTASGRRTHSEARGAIVRAPAASALEVREESVHGTKLSVTDDRRASERTRGDNRIAPTRRAHHA